MQTQVNHREGSRRSRAHAFITKNARMERGDVVKHLVKTLRVKKSTAGTWFQTFKRGAPKATKKSRKAGKAKKH